jgi:hypothetical protein
MSVFAQERHGRAGKVGRGMVSSSREPMRERKNSEETLRFTKETRCAKLRPVVQGLMPDCVSGFFLSEHDELSTPGAFNKI